MNYELTEFTLEELSLLSEALKQATRYDRTKEGDTLREINVRVLTAFSIVKERERTTNQ